MLGLTCVWLSVVILVGDDEQSGRAAVYESNKGP